MDIAAFRHRMGYSQAELAENVGLATPTIGNLCSPTSPKRPSYEVIEKLFLLGARLDEVFSPEVQEVVLNNSIRAGVAPSVYRTPEFQEGVKMAIEAMRAKGIDI